jgi:hypothetical protein
VAFRYASGLRRIRPIFLCAWVLASAACTQLDPSGTVWYGRQDSRDLSRLSLHSGVEEIVDSRGPYATLVADRGSRQIAYVSDGRVMAGTSDGELTELLSAGDLTETALTWHSGGWLSYPVQHGGAYQQAIARPPATGRLLDGGGHPVISQDGRFVAFCRESRDPSGEIVEDLVLESIDGTSLRVLGRNSDWYGLVFSPDSTSLAATHSNGTMFQFWTEIESERSLGVGYGVPDALRLEARAYSHDGERVLIWTPEGIAALSFTSGERELVVPASDDTSVQLGFAFFVDESSVAYSTLQKKGTGDTAERTRRIVLQRNGVTHVLVTSGPGLGSSYCGPVALEFGRRIGIQCDGHVQVFSVEDGTAIFAAVSDEFLGSDAQLRAVVVQRGNTIMYIDDVGNESTVVSADTTIRAAYAP